MLLKNSIKKDFFYNENDKIKLNWERIDSNNKNLSKFAKTNQELFNFIFCHSPYLSDCIVHDQEYWETAVNKDPEILKNEIFKSAKNSWQANDQQSLMTDLRLAKKRISTLCGIMDITEGWAVMEITKILSEFADISVHSALNNYILNLGERNCLTINNPKDPATDSGFCILGMGKLGGFELNYSSDIDLIAFYDIDKITTDDKGRFQEIAIKEFKNLITVIESITKDGYVFRTDFRLRPNPSMTPIIMSKLAMLQYYESMGLNWERSAMIKARPIAGDIEVGNQFLEDIHSFIWRKNLDFEALEDIFYIKNKINEHRNLNEIKLAGQNVKLGIGGIREIEFFAQSQQLIWGGRNGDLRGKQTLQTIEKLVAMDKVEKTIADKLTNAYLYLRHVEHRLQMTDDKQTHIVPENEDDLVLVANFCGFKTVAEFEQTTINHMQTVAGIYTKLFNNDNSVQQSNEKTELKQNDKISEIINSWESSSYRCFRSERARLLINQITPQIITAFSKQPNPEKSIMLFDTFLSKLPTGVELFSMFKSNPKILETMAKIIANAPRLSAVLTSRVHMIDVLISNTLEKSYDKNALQKILNSHLTDVKDLQDIFEQTKAFKSEMFFEQGVKVLENKIKPIESLPTLTNIADTVITNIIPPIVENMEKSYGKISGGNFAIIAMGKFGSKELMHRSDLDLVFVCDYDDPNAQSDGEKSLPAQQYYVRLCQRIINGISTNSGDGIIFEIDTRLRPNGKSGSIACQKASFDNYYTDNKAWRWEFMALTNARVVYSTADKLTDELQSIIKRNLTKKFNIPDIHTAILKMRQTMEDEFFDGVGWFIKHRPGGLVDIEFIIQGLKLEHAKNHPEILQTGNMNSLIALNKFGVIDDKTFQQLSYALELWYNIQGIVRLTTVKRFNEETASHGQIESLLEITEYDDINKLRIEVDKTATAIRKIFNKTFKG